MHKSIDFQVSVIITCYNQEAYISQAIQSVLDQTYNQWECIVVNDGSTDKSASIINEYVKQDKRIKIVDQKNQGVSIARNNGFSATKGAYIQFLDGDDCLIDSKFEKQLEYFNSNSNIDVCYVDHRYYYEREKQYKNFEFERISELPLKDFLYKWHLPVAIPSHSFLYRRSIWEEDELPFPAEYIYREEDWVFNVLTSMKGVRYGYIHQVLCTYRVENDNFTSSIFNSCSNTLDAAMYIMNYLEPDESLLFWNHVKTKTFIRLIEGSKPQILKSSSIWKIGFIFSFPLHITRKYFLRFKYRSKTKIGV